MVEQGDEIRLRIDSITSEGNGLGHYFDRSEDYEYTVFVPYGVPGDEIWAKVLEQDHGNLQAEILRVIAKSPARKEPVCPHFEDCGACSWQHIAYQNQLRIKQQLVHFLLRKKCRMLIPVDEILGSPDAFNYRMRARFKGDVVNGRAVLGYHQRSKHSIVEVQQCYLVHPQITKTINMLRQFFRERTLDHAFKFEVEIHAKESSSMVVLSFYTPKSAADYMMKVARIFQKHYSHVIRGVAVFDLDGNLMHISSDKLLSDYTIDSPRELTYRYRPGSFTQVNLPQNRTLINTVFTFAGLTGMERVLDLYCGIGNFALALAHHAEEVVGLESNPQAVKDAVLNQQFNQKHNCTFQCIDVEKGVQNLIVQGNQFDVIIADPAREGLGSVANHLHKLKPEKIVYISCNPEAMANDLNTLMKHGFQVKRVQPIDMFPQTHHIETVVLLYPIKS